jgi:Zn-dependent M28 family amino/carboxypeptidase
MKIRLSYLYLFLFAGMLVVASCKSEPKVAPPKPVKKVDIPSFNGDGAYNYVQQQVDFGVRVPGTATHKACKDFLVAELEKNGATVKVQEFKASFFDVKDAESYNIIAAINPEKKHRVLLAAHWDTRLLADKDDKDQDKPIDGADDGASGVGVLLQLAKTIQENPIDLGVDIIFFDAEDNGIDADTPAESDPKSWCLGSQYWAENKDRNYTAKFGILLDMVGAKDAVFPLEGYSTQKAGLYQDKLWTLAGRMGYGDLFQKKRIGGITDDHFYMNEAGIPSVDIINYPGVREEDGFGHYHHTHDDNMDNIDKNTLRIVGQVVTAVIYKESGNSF